VDLTYVVKVSAALASDPSKAPMGRWHPSNRLLNSIYIRLHGRPRQERSDVQQSGRRLRIPRVLGRLLANVKWATFSSPLALC